MWPFSSYPEYSASDVHDKTYDYVIVGGGTAGCALASRLSEDPNVTVLVIDKGHVNNNIVSRMPLISQNMFLGDVLQVQSERWSEPMAGANGRRSRLWAVEGIGGASRMNGMLWTRGFPGDYAAWAEMGLDDWSYEKLEPYFRKIENAVSHPESSFRGHSGPINIQQLLWPFVWVKHLKQSAQDLDLRLQKDINDPSAPAMGLFDLDVAISKRGTRISALSAYLNETVSDQRRNRLTICTGTVVSRLEADAQSGIVTGVHLRSSKEPDRDYFVKVRREVVLCSGAPCTPQVLLLSGIGPVESLEALDIPIVKDMPAVGATLSDHYSVPIMLAVPKKETIHLLQSIWGIWHFLLWIFFGKGLLSLTAMSSAIYVHSDAIDRETMQVKDRDEEGRDALDASLSRNIPDIEVMIIPMSTVEREVVGPSMMSIYPTLCQPHGMGRIELASTDPFAQPRVTYPMFSTEQDIATARLAVRFSMRLAEKLQESDYPYPAKLAFAPGQDATLLDQWEKSAPAEYLPIPILAAPFGQQMPIIDAKAEQNTAVGTRPKSGAENKTWRNVTDHEIDDYMKRVAHTSLHFSGTCPMSNDPRTGVVDQQLRVHGFSNLRIADTSVFPKIPSCHTMAPVLVVAERCADMIKATWKDKKSQ
ncbi:hypothetical protein E8E14_010014 [Neopestalotiopsis sp. 37M]|nr:hypothetical protein E8E14_010014 [Neopestalotiopsis sp. 37M]